MYPQINIILSFCLCPADQRAVWGYCLGNDQNQLIINLEILNELDQDIIVKSIHIYI